MAVAAFTLSGCNAFLDTTPSDRISDKMTWTKTEYVDLYVNNFYEYLSVYGQFGSQQFNGSITEGLTNTFKYGSVSPGSAAGDANDYVYHPEKLQPSGSLLDIWSSTYTRIRRINEFLDSQKKYSTFSEEVNLRYEAQARFFRAYLYFQLAKRHTKGGDYGGLVLHTSLNMEKATPLSSAQDVWQLIYADLDFAAKNLPEAWDPANFGRITSYGAYAFMSRAMLYAERWEDAKNAAECLDAIENMLFLMDEYSRYKTRFVEESINGMFRIARFRLFREQANGGVEDRCDVVHEGVPYISVNNGMKINLGIDIINTLSMAYGVRVPLFVDNAESVTQLETSASQIIRLVVNEDDKELRVNYEN